ncbi:MAG: glycosyltransferase family 4 protein [Clostridia bacterium]|nr:glycosyltransferase family 4 protein [Clostridia bacterium]
MNIKDNMKILIYSHDSSFYGAPKAVFDLTNELRKVDYEIIYAIPCKGKLEENLIKEKYEYVILPNPQWIVADRKPDYSRWYYFKHYVKSLLIFIKSFVVAYRTNLKAVKEIEPDVIFVNTSVALVGLYVAKHLKIKSVLWIHEPLCNRVGWQVPALLPKRYVGRVLNKADVIMGPSKFLKDYIERTFGISRMQVLPNAIDYIPQLSDAYPAYTFGMVGSISERKGQLDFFRAMLKNMPEANLIVFGTGTNDYAQKLYEEVSKYPQNIKMYGYESDLNVIYSSFDIYVNMGIDETFGRTTVEAMGAGKLVFGRRSGATPEIIRHGENGFLFDNVDEIFEILKEYDNKDGHEMLQSIRRRGLETSLLYMPEEIMKCFDAVMKEITK